nr:phage antirepressor KilAC domain-containing protein [Duganella margarita]
MISAIAAPKMTSREIADLTGKEHFHVKRDIEKMLRELGEDASKFGCIYLDGSNREQTEYALDRELTDVLLTGYSAILRRKVIARWRELEAVSAAGQIALPDFTNPAAAARAWADEVEAKQALQVELAAAAPAVEFVERYVDASGLLGFRQACKVLKVKENVFREFLLTKEIAYRLGRELAPRAEHLNAGRFEVKAGVSAKNEHAFNSMRFTTKGLHWVAGEFAKHQLASQAHHH